VKAATKISEAPRKLATPAPSRPLLLVSKFGDPAKISAGFISLTKLANDNKQDPLMGVMTQKHNDLFIITSDRGSDDPSNKMAPKRRSTVALRVWTGNRWSAEIADAQTFVTVEAADDYTQANLGRVMHDGGTSPERPASQFDAS
jgi:hypothetical protein